jgi:hypothetical protein
LHALKEFTKNRGVQEREESRQSLPEVNDEGVAAEVALPTSFDEMSERIKFLQTQQKSLQGIVGDALQKALEGSTE